MLYAYSKIPDTNMVAWTRSSPRCRSRADLSAVIRVAAVLFVTVLTVVAAQVSVPLPFTPVPFTLQPMVVLLGGAALGSRLGHGEPDALSCRGRAGLPVFAASPILPQGRRAPARPDRRLSLSYPFAAFATGWLAERGFDRRYLTSGRRDGRRPRDHLRVRRAWLAFVAPQLGLRGASAAGFIPFIPADMLKVFVAAAVLPAAWRITRADTYRT